VGTFYLSGGLPAYANVCDQLAARIAQLVAEEDAELAGGSIYVPDERSLEGIRRGTLEESLTAPTGMQRESLRGTASSVRRLRAQRASYERQYAKKNCGEYRAQRDAAAAAATGAALGAIGFGIMSGAMSGGYRGSSGGSSYRSGSSGRSSYPSGSSYRRY
jgi:hypothetical protein